MKKNLFLLPILLFLFHPQLTLERDGEVESPKVESILRMGPGSAFGQSSGKLPLQFEANLGQADARARFISRGPGYLLFLTESEAVLSLGSEGLEDSSETADHLLRHSAEGVNGPTGKAPAAARLRLVGSERPTQIAGLDKLPGRVNYYRGNDPDRWVADVPTYSKVKYDEVYPGVDVVYYSREGQLEYDFLVSPRSDPGRITFSFEGTGNPAIDDNGDLLLPIRDSAIRLKRPEAYQLAGNMKREVSARYLVNDDQSVSFGLGDYEPDRDLIIDPVLSYSTYLGGSNTDSGRDITSDADGNAYVVGYSASPDFPGAAQPAAADVFVSKLNADGSELMFTTILGGSFFDEGWGIALDSEGAIYVAGHTKSNDFPTTPGAWRSDMFFTDDGFTTKLNPSGSIVYSTYLSGGNTDFDGAQDIAVDGDGFAYVTGRAKEGFPATSGVLDTTFTNAGDVFVLKMNQNGTNLVYSTALGESSIPGGIAVDAAGNAYVTGTAFGSFPTTEGAFYDGNTNGFSDIFVSKLNPTATGLVYSTLIKEVEAGGGGRGAGIAVDQNGNALVTGFANADFPVTDESNQLFDPPRLIFVTKLNAAGSDLEFSTLLGFGMGTGIVTDAAGNAFVTGYAGFRLTTVNPIQSALQGRQDAFVAMYDPEGSIVFSSFLGGNGDENDLYIGGIAVDDAGDVLVAGETFSSDFPTASFQDSLGGFSDAFVTRLSDGLSEGFTLYFAQFGNGEGLISDIVLTNPSAENSVTGRVDFFDSDGDALLIGIAEGGAAPAQRLRSFPQVQQSGVDFEVGPSDAVTISTDGQDPGLNVGAAVVSASGRLGGVVRFAVSLLDLGVVGVGDSQPVSGFITPVRRKEGGVNTGVALHNPGDQPVDVTLRLFEQGVEVESVTIEDFPGHGHLAQFIDQIFGGTDTSNFVGTMIAEVEGGQVAATALEQALAPGQFTALPVTPLN